MNDFEKYEFDLNGYLLVKGLLSPSEFSACLTATNELEGHFLANVDAGPQLLGYSHIRYRFDEKYQCHSYKNESGGGLQLILDDFLNASEVFDTLVAHEPTMDYVREMAVGPHWIGNSELRFRYRSNFTDTHMGGRLDTRNRYEFVGVSMFDSDAQVRAVRDFNLRAVRVLYALEDMPVEHGPLCVVPGTHKSNYFSPYNDSNPQSEPGMIPLPMKAGDAIIFTENLRHGGFPNLLDRPRKTLHLMFSPRWVGSQSPVHWNDKVYVSEEAWARYTPAQRALLPTPSGNSELQLKILRDENKNLKAENELLKARSMAPEPVPVPDNGIIPALRKLIGI